MTKVCHMTSVHPNKDIRILYKECVTLADNGYEVVLIAPGEDLVENNVQIKGIGLSGTNRLKRMLFMGKKVYKLALKENADIYHFHDPELLPYGLKLKKMGKKVIYDSHEDVPRQILAKHWIPSKMRKIISKFYEKYEKAVAKRLDYVVTVTDHIADIFKKYHCKVVVVKNFPLLNDIQCKLDNYATRENIICYAGGVTEQRGITTLIKAISDLDIQLNIAGSLSEEYKERLKCLPGWDKVNYVGYLDREGISRLYNESRIGMVTLKDTPNHRYSLPIKMFEYMAAGIPIIVSNFPTWVEVIEEVHCGLCVNPNSEKEIAMAIQYLLNKPEEAKIMGENGRKAVCEKFSWENEAKKLIKLYQKIL